MARNQGNMICQSPAEEAARALAMRIESLEEMHLETMERELPFFARFSGRKNRKTIARTTKMLLMKISGNDVGSLLREVEAVGVEHVEVKQERVKVKQEPNLDDGILTGQNARAKAREEEESSDEEQDMDQGGAVQPLEVDEAVGEGGGSAISSMKQDHGKKILARVAENRKRVKTWRLQLRGENVNEWHDCGTLFRSYKELKNHVQTSRKVQCRKCRKAFPCMSQWKRARRAARKSQHRCPICVGQGYVQARGLRKHLKNVHGVKPENMATALRANGDKSGEECRHDCMDRLK